MSTYQYNNETPPRAGYTWSASATTTIASTTIPSTWAGKFMSVHADRASWVLFANTSGITSTTTVGGTNSMTPLAAGATVRIRPDGVSDTWMFYSAAATSVIRMWVSSP